MTMMSKRRALASPLPKGEPDLRSAHKRAILAALRWAWDELGRVRPGLVDTANEETITEALERLLNEYERGVRRAHWLEDFGVVTRGSKVRTSDGRLEKQPDLHFRPTTYRNVLCASDWAWFVECKIIDGAASWRLYREHGVARFHAGEYAVRMRSAAMVGYCRDGSAPLEVLSTVLENQQGTSEVLAGRSGDECRSTHRRKRPLKGTIKLTHLWLFA